MVEMTWGVHRDEDGRMILAATWLSRSEHNDALPLAG